MKAGYRDVKNRDKALKMETEAGERRPAIKGEEQ